MHPATAPEHPQPREIDLCDPRTTGRIGEVVRLRSNEDAAGGRGRLVRVSLDPDALDVSANEVSRDRVARLIRLGEEERITFLPPLTLATVAAFGSTPAGRPCARLKAGLLACRGLSAWCLMREVGDPLPAADPPIHGWMLNNEPDLRALRARHPAYYARACRSEAWLLDTLFLLRGSLEVLVMALRDGFEPQDRAIQERHAHDSEAEFVDLRQRAESAPAFLHLTPSEKAAIRRDVFRIDFEKDPFQ